MLEGLLSFEELNAALLLLLKSHLGRKNGTEDSGKNSRRYGVGNRGICDEYPISIAACCPSPVFSCQVQATMW